ncbi:LamG-like jellyroll fold domain-containing protein [Streptosporangium amethystogenes]|uniref:LamG-like jellyroll fold domain-containing protein n=1 Tax=Streptosporangium amethystogenes TaxID=2002 RepID=UPI0037B507EF
MDATKKEAKRQNKRIEIESYRAENSTTFANPDGKTLYTELHSTPIRVQKNGTWQQIDTTLVEENGVIKPKAVKSDLTLSVGGNTALVTANSDKGKAVISAPGKLPKPQLSGSTATYPSAYGQGIDLVVTATPTGFRHDIVIRQRPTTKKLTLRIPTTLPKGLKFGKTADGKPALLTGTGKDVNALPAAPMIDAAAMNNPDAGHIADAPATVEQTSSGDTVVLTPDSTFLADPAVTYPVTLVTASEDWTGTGIAGDTHVSTVLPDGDANSTLPWLLAGRSHSGTRTHHSYIRFNIKDTPLEGATTIENADLRLFNQDSHDCDDTSSPGIVARRITTAWTVSSLTWDTQPSVTFNGQVGNKGAYSATRCPEGEGELYYSIEDMVRAWVSGAPDYGVQLSSASGSEAQNWRYYRSDEYGGYDTYPFTPRGPVLLVKYEPAQVFRAVWWRPDDGTEPTIDEAMAHINDARTTPREVTILSEAEADALAEQSSTTSIDDLMGEGPPPGLTPEQIEEAGGPDNIDEYSQPDGCLLARWTFDEGTGVIANDSSGYAYRATLKGTAAWTPGHLGQSMSSTGTPNHAEVSEPVIATEKSYSIAGWLRLRDANQSYEMIRQSGTNKSPFYIGTEAGASGLSFLMYPTDSTDAVATGIRSGISPPLNEWFHIAGVYDSAAGKISLYLNGQLIKTEPVAASWRSRGNLLLGAKINGEIDDVRVYAKALGPEDVAAAKENTPVPSCETPASDTGERGHWAFDEGTGTTAADSSGRGHNATLNSETTWVPGKTGTALSNIGSPAQAQSVTSDDKPLTSMRAVTSRDAQAQGKRVEVADETSATSITYAQPDGETFKTEIAAGPVRTKQGNAWVPIDTTLAEQGGKLRPKALAEGTAVEISAGGTDPFVKMSADGKSYALTWPTPLPKPTIKGSVATYTDAAGVGADLVVTVLPTGFRHDVVLRERPAKPLELRIGVDTGGLTLTKGKGGRLLLTDTKAGTNGKDRSKDNKLVASAPQPVMWDASAGARLATGRLPQARHAKIATDVVTTGGRTELVLKPDHAFLSDPATRYPVRVDPTTTLPFNHDVEVASTSDADSPADPTAWYLMAGRLFGDLSRVHLRFDTAALAGSTVTDARLSLLNIDAQGCGPTVGPGIQVRRLTSAWDENNLYWANKPTSTTEDAQINRVALGPTCEPAPLEWPVTAIAQDWAGGAANHGLVLQHPNEANTNDNYRVFPSAEETFEFNSPPTLTVTTTGPASAPTIGDLTITPAQAAGGVTTVTSLTPQLAATVSDTIGGTLTGEFEIEHDPAATGQGTGQIWASASTAVASGGRAAVSVPGGKLVDGWKVRWRARAVNAGASTTSVWSPWQLITVDVSNSALQPLAHTAASVIRTDQNFTAAAWLRWTDKDGAYSIVEQKGTNNIPFRLGNDPDRGLVFTLTQSDAPGAATQGVLSGIEPPVNEWFHLAGVYDASVNTAALYLNGNLIKKETIGFPAWNANSAMTLGASMEGDLDGLRLHQRSLSANEIAVLYDGAGAQTPQATDSSVSPSEKPETLRVEIPTQSEPDRWTPEQCRGTAERPDGTRWISRFSRCLKGTGGWGIEWIQSSAGRKELGRVKFAAIAVADTFQNRREFDVFVDVKVTKASGTMATAAIAIDMDAKGFVNGSPSSEHCKPDATEQFGYGEQRRVKTAPQWVANPKEWYRYYSPKSGTSGTESISRCRFGFSVGVVGRPGANDSWLEIDPDRYQTSVRCDTTTYLRWNTAGGCVFTDTTTVMRMSPEDIDEATKNGWPEQSQHIWRALNRPDVTEPVPGDVIFPNDSGKEKNIPGNFGGKKLHRLADRSLSRENYENSVKTCRIKFKDQVPWDFKHNRDPKTKAIQCDEFPFASTKEGSKLANPAYNYSVWLINAYQNWLWGKKLRYWYENNRMLRRDGFWISIEAG